MLDVFDMVLSFFFLSVGFDCYIVRLVGLCFVCIVFSVGFFRCFCVVFDADRFVVLLI